MGPEGGSGGGQIIAEGFPEKIAEISQSYTGKFLKNLINNKMKKIA
jgi:excinuclease ABC subunit A